MKMKGKIKSVLAILAVLLLAAILAFVGIFLVKNNNSSKVAEAAIAPNSSKISITNQKYAYLTTQSTLSPVYENMIDMQNPGDDTYYTHFVSSVTSNSQGINDQKLVLAMDATTQYTKSTWTDFTVSITVPRYTKYEIDYTLGLKGCKMQNKSGTTNGLRIEFYDFSYGHDNTTGINAGSINNSTQFKPAKTEGTICSQDPDTYGVWSNVTTQTGNISANTGVILSYTHNQSFICDNTASSTDTTYSFNFGTYVMLGFNSSGYKTRYRCEIDLKENITISQTDAPTMSGDTSYEYDGNPHDFNFTYNSAQVAVSKLTKTELNGTVSTLYSYDTTSGATTGTNPMVIGGSSSVLSLTDAGKYEISFDLINGWVYDNTNFDQAIKKFTIYINPIMVDKPTADPNAAAGLAYNFSPQTFTLGLSGVVNSSTWSNYIAIAGSLPSGLTDNGDGSFEATDAGTYNLNLKLADENNTIWTDNWDTTAWNPVAGGILNFPLTINPKQVNAPTGISPTTAEYDGNPRTTTLLNWDQSLIDAVNLSVSGDATIDTTHDSVRTISATDTGAYTIKAALKTRADGGCNFVWNSTTGDTQDKTFTFTITTGGLPSPTLSGSSTAPYNDGEGIDFTVDNFVVGQMDVVRTNASLTSTTGTMPMTWDDGLSFDGTKFTAKNAGTYDIQFALTDHDNTQWDAGGGTTANQSLSFEVTKKPVIFPSAPSGTYSYTGEEQTTNLVGWSNYHKLTVSGDTSSVDNTNGDISFKNAGTYTVSVALKDPDNTKWADGTTPVDLPFTVAPKTLNVAVTNSLGTSWQAGETGTIQLELSGCVATDTVIFTAFYLKDDETRVVSNSGQTNGTTDTSVSATLATQNLGVGTFKLDAELDALSASNYTIDKTAAGLPLTLTVTPESASTTLKWQYTVNGANASPATTTGSGDNLAVDGSEIAIVYKLNSDGTTPVEYEFKVDETQLPDGVLINTDQYNGGYKDNKASAVGTYTATVAIKCEDGYEFEGGLREKDCKLTFTIEKGDFDTSGIKWEYTLTGDSTPKEYTAAVEYAQKMYKLVVIPDTLPAGLEVKDYKNSEKMAVGTYTAEVSFKCNTDNFDLPANVTLQWEIKAAEIKVNWDFGAEYPVLTDPRAGETVGIVKYTFYTDSACTTEIAKGDIVADDTQEVTYFVKAEIASGQTSNYTLTDPSGNNCITDFSVGGNKLPLTIQASFGGDGYYNGEAYAATVTVSGVPGLVEGTDYILSYYSVADDGTETPLDEAPVAAGKYCVKVTLTRSAAAYYTISGNNRFETEIKKGVLDLSNLKWNYTEAFQYGTQDGTPIVYKVELTGLPEYLQGLVKYTGNEYSRYGKYSASFEFENFDSINYEQLVYPEGFTAELKWEIGMRMLKKPTVKPRRAHYTGEELTAELEGFDAEYMEIVSGELKGTEIGDYAVTVALKANDFVRWEDNSNAPLVLTFTIVSPGEPLDPDNPDNPPPPDNPDTPNTPDDPNKDDPKPVEPGVTDDNNGGGLPDGFPLWQVIVGGVSIVLGAIFLAKLLAEISQLKGVKYKADKLSKAYAGAMVNGMLFGVSEMWWTVIACSLAGVAVALFIAMLVVGRALSNARRNLDDAEQAFREAEKREEKQRHDEEMKMLMMMMNGGGKGGAPVYTGNAVDVKEIVTQVVAALLPTMQQAAAQITAGSGDYDDAELKRRLSESERRIEEMQELLDKDDGFDDVIEVDLDELN